MALRTIVSLSELASGCEPLEILKRIQDIRPINVIPLSASVRHCADGTVYVSCGAEIESSTRNITERLCSPSGNLLSIEALALYGSPRHACWFTRLGEQEHHLSQTMEGVRLRYRFRLSHKASSRPKGFSSTLHCVSIIMVARFCRL